MRTTGAVPWPRSATPTPACWWWVWRPQPTEATGRGGCSPATAAATGSSARCTGPGFANQPESVRISDGLELTGALITAAARCAPPQNKLRPDELTACRPYITREIELLTDLRAVVALGRIAFDAFLRAYAAAGGAPPDRKPPFGHNVATDLPNGGPLLIASYHPSQQNTQTGRLTLDMLDAVFTRARAACNW